MTRCTAILLKKITAIVAVSIAIDDIFLEMIQSHNDENCLTLVPVVDIDAVCDTQMSGVEWSHLKSPAPGLRRISCADVFLVGSDSETRGRVIDQAWSFVVS